MSFGSVVQQKGGTTNTASPLALAFTSNNTAGNILVCAGRNGGGTYAPSTIVDSQGNTWVRLISDNWSTGNEFFVFYCLNCKGGANTVTVTGHDAISNLLSMCIGEYSGNGANNTLDTSAFADTGASGTWTTADSGPITPASNGELLIAAQGNATAPASVAAGSGWTNLINDSLNVASLESQVQATAASIHGIF